MIESMGRGVLGPPVKPADDKRGCGAAPYAFFFTSFTAENSIPSARSLV
jgi:hypothetical protein